MPQQSASSSSGPLSSPAFSTPDNVTSTSLAKGKSKDTGSADSPSPAGSASHFGSGIIDGLVANVNGINGHSRTTTSASTTDRGRADESLASSSLSSTVEDGSMSEESALLDHIYQRGFIRGEFADVALHTRPSQQPLRLHSLIISTSPTLAELLQHYPNIPQSASIGNGSVRDLVLPLENLDDVTNEAIVLAIGYLYSTRSLASLNAANAPGVLSAALLLQLPGLIRFAGQVCLETIDGIVSPSQCKFWVDYNERLQQRAAMSQSAEELSWSHTLQQALVSRLVTSLPTSLHAFSASQTSPQQATESQSILRLVYSCLPFELFKAVVESPSLGAGAGDVLTDQSRFALAKRCIADRKKLAQKGQGSTSGPVDYEETVVLAFGFGNGAGSGNVNIVKKPVQSRRLWKVGGS